MNKPVAVLISDIHFTMNTLPLASSALETAIDKARELKVPIIVAGDLHDSKAMIRAECANAILEIIRANHDVFIYVIVGNHDLINEKGTADALHFLDDCCSVVRAPTNLGLGVYAIPYQSSPEAFKEAVASAREGATIVCHQGLQSADMGHYVQDHSAAAPEDLKGRRIVSGHYHRAQEVKLPRGGLWTYLGNPYSLSYGEADHGRKGYAVLMKDGDIVREFLDLPRHVIMERSYDDLPKTLGKHYRPGDKLWLKITGPSVELKKIKKAEVMTALKVAGPFKFDLIPTESAPTEGVDPSEITEEELFDGLIDSSPQPDVTKAELKALWRQLTEE